MGMLTTLNPHILLAGFNHAWSNDSYHWQDFIKRPARTITCKSLEKEAAFRFQAFGDFDKEDGPLA